MKSKVLAALVATMAVGATCAFAANPFVDVPSDSWAYKSVVELADAGIIQGVDGQYFQGERNITRYEAAEMVAKAMAHQDKATVEQRALINKLADEYADELNNLGVRVSALESRVGNVKLSGDARIRYQYQNGTSSKENDNSWDYRARLRATANVNDNTTVAYGISTNNHSFGDSQPASAGTFDNGKADLYTDMAKVDTKFGDLTASVGRDAAYVLGGGAGYQYGDVFDRAQLTYNNGKIAATAGYGKFKENAGVGYFGENFTNQNLNDVKTGYGELAGFFGNGSKLGVYYNSFNGTNNGSTTQFHADDLWGAYASLNFGQKFNFLTDYQDVNFNDGFTAKDTGDDNGSAWYSKLTYGKATMAQPKSWDLWVEYLDADQGAFLGGVSNLWRNFAQMDNITSWGAGIDYTFAKNAQFNVMQSFGTNTKDGSDADPEEVTRAQFVFAF